MHDLGTLGGARSYGYALNDQNFVTGTSYLAGNAVQHAFLYDGTMHDLGALGPGDSDGTGINNAGKVVGISQILAHAERYAVLFDGTTINQIGPPASSADSINGTGNIVGGFNTADSIHGFFYDGSFHDIGTLGGPSSTALGINEHDEITGQSATLAGPAHAFLFDGTMHDLGVIPNSVFTQSAGVDINDSGQIVGYAFDVGLTIGDHYRAFVYSKATGMMDLNSLIDPESGWLLQFANGINNVGQIVGSGRIDGSTRAFRLTPVPEPDSLVLLVIGTLIMVFACRRNQARNVCNG